MTVRFADSTAPLTVATAGRWIALATEEPHQPPYEIELVDANDRVIWQETVGPDIADMPGGGPEQLTPRERARLIVLRPSDMPPGCDPRSTCIGDLTLERAQRERLLSDGRVLVDCGYLAGEQFGFERAGMLEAQHGVLLFADTRGAGRAYRAVASQKPTGWSATQIGVGDEAELLTAQSTRQLLWRTGQVVQILMMRRKEQQETVNLARRLTERARRVAAL